MYEIPFLPPSWVYRFNYTLTVAPDGGQYLTKVHAPNPVLSDHLLDKKLCVITINSAVLTRFTRARRVDNSHMDWQQNNVLGVPMSAVVTNQFLGVNDANGALEWRRKIEIDGQIM